MAYENGRQRSNGQLVDQQIDSVEGQLWKGRSASIQSLVDRPEVKLPTHNNSAGTAGLTKHTSTNNSELGESQKSRSGESFQSTQVLKMLREASMVASECNRDVWDFAVEIAEVVKLNIPRHILRSLVCQNLIEHRREITQESEPARSFIPETDIVLSQRSCFVLTESGVTEAENLAIEANKLAYNGNYHAQQQTMNPLTNNQDKSLPIWDADSREFRLGPIVVKRFKWPARNQEQILRAFQQNNWPQKISNPLPEDEEVCSKAQLHDTIKCLNRNQVNKAIKFRGDGTGRGVFWEIIQD